MGTSYGPPRVVGVGVGGGPAWANGRRRANAPASAVISGSAPGSVRESSAGGDRVRAHPQSATVGIGPTGNRHRADAQIDHGGTLHPALGTLGQGLGVSGM